MATFGNWHPAAEAVSLRDAVDRLLEQSFLRPRSTGDGAAPAQGWRMPLDIYETPADLVIRAWAPGVEPDKLAITWEQGTLAIRAPIQQHAPDTQATWYARELPQGEVYATVGLPGTLNIDTADASFENGVLTLRIPKAEAARPKQIRVRVGS